MTHPELPQNIEAEKATLGSILLNREAIVAVAPWLLAEYFYMDRHAQIYEAMLACYNARIPPDTRTVSEELRRRDRLDSIGGVPYLSDLDDTVPTSYHVEYYARIVERTARSTQHGTRLALYRPGRSGRARRRSNPDFIHIGQVIDQYYEQ